MKNSIPDVGKSVFKVDRKMALGNVAPEKRASVKSASVKPARGAVTLTALPEGHVLHILGFRTSQADRVRLAGVSSAPFALRESGVDQLFLIGDEPLDTSSRQEIADKIGDGFYISDQSAGRVRLEIKGPGVAGILNKGVGINLSPQAFPTGKSAQTLCGHIGVHLTRTGDEAFEIMVLRSYAQSLWYDLLEMCAT